MLTLVILLILKGVQGEVQDIIGGLDIHITEATYQVSLQNRTGNHYCGGALIATDLVLSAAHCVFFSFNFNDIYLYLGSTSRSKGGIRARVKDIKYHQRYNGFEYDIAVLRLKEHVTVTKTVKPINLARKEPPVGSEVFATGWGKLDFEHPDSLIPIYLQGVTLKVSSKEECKKIFKDIQNVQDENLCAYRLGKDTCVGDSGGPLAYKGELLGIVSWGVGCANKGYPGVYASIPAFYDWIQNVITNVI